MNFVHIVLWNKVVEGLKVLNALGPLCPWLCFISFPPAKACTAQTNKIIYGAFHCIGFSTTVCMIASYSPRWNDVMITPYQYQPIKEPRVSRILCQSDIVFWTERIIQGVKLMSLSSTIKQSPSTGQGDSTEVPRARHNNLTSWNKEKRSQVS